MDFFRLFSGSEPFNKLEKRGIKNIAASFHPRTLSSGTTILKQGESVSEIGFIASGRVSLAMIGNHKKLFTFDMLTKGDFFGFEFITPHACSPFCAFCESSVRCYFQKIEDYIRTTKSFPVLNEWFYHKAFLRMAKALDVLKEDFIRVTKSFPVLNELFYQKAFLRMAKALDVLKEDADNRQGQATDKILFFPQAIEKAMIYIEKNYMTPMTLDEIARVNGMSKYHFARVFKKKSGYTFKQYLNRRRMEKAKALMQFKDMNVSEACFAVGYNDLAHFSRLFQKLEGLSPSVYRKNLKK